MSVSFPTILLPQPNYKYIDCSLGEFFLVRYFDLAEHTPIHDENDDITSDYICSPRGNIQDLSTSLLSHFIYDDTKIKLTAEGNAMFGEYCLPSYKGERLYSPEHFDIKEDRKFWVIPAGLFDGIKVTITLGTTDVEAVSYIQHTPMKWNFWHFSLRWIVETRGDLLIWTDVDDREAKKIRDKIGSKARSKLAALARYNFHGPQFILKPQCFQN